MNRLFTFWMPLAAGLMAAGNGFAQESYFRTPVQMDAYPAARTANQTVTKSTLAAYFDEAAEEADDDSDADKSNCGCETPSCGCDANYGCGDNCCEPSCGCDNGCCGCNSGWGSCLGDCCLGDPWTLQGYLQPCCDRSTAYGGWFSMGYYNHNERLSREPGDELSFNDFPHHLNLDQAWFYVEHAANADACSADWGYRFDIMYGVHAHAAQAFGNEDNVWDVSLDHGVYGWAMPQLYAEVAYGDWDVKIGHWFTPAGYEVIPDTGNFFYSHTLTHYNSEPFTHTGVLGTYNGYDDATIYAGWSLGWDTGFDQYDDGNIFIGGLTYKPNCNVSLTYITTVGNLGWKSEGEFGYTQHIVGIFDLSENWQYVIQSDYLDTDGVPGDDDTDGEDKGVTNYLFYTLNDCWAVGGRVEWWKSNNVIAGENASFYDITGGLNYQATANLVVRPEIRYDWTPSDEAYENEFDVDYNQTWFGIDAVLTY
jgi:hypothetical protein